MEVLRGMADWLRGAAAPRAGTVSSYGVGTVPEGVGNCEGRVASAERYAGTEMAGMVGMAAAAV